MTKKYGFRIFLILVFSQVISLVGSGLSDFALSFYVLKDVVEGGAGLLAFSMIYFFVYFPGMVTSLFTGTIIDNHNKKTILIISNLIAAIATIFTLCMVLLGSLEIWHIYLAASIKSIAAAFQIPAFQSCITLLVKEEDYGKAYGYAQMGESLHRVVSPIIAGSLFSIISIQGILIIDLLCFIIGVIPILFMNISQTIKKNVKSHATFWKDTIEGYRFFIKDKGLVNLLVYFVISNFLLGFVQVWVQPLVYSLIDLQQLSIDRAQALGIVMTAGGVGMMIGSIVMGMSGGPENKVKGILIFNFLGGAVLLAAAFTNSLTVFAIGAFVYFLTIPFVQGCNMSIWQKRVPDEYQGRVFSLRRSTVLAVLPLSFVLAGIIGDWIEPIFQNEGSLTNISKFVGIGIGEGYIFLFSIIGLLSIIVSLFGFFNRGLRKLEQEENQRRTSEVKAV